MNPAYLQSVQETARSLYAVSQGFFWDGLPLAFLASILVIFLSGQVTSQAFEGLFRRLIIAILLVVATPQISAAIYGVSDHLASAYGGIDSYRELFQHVGDRARAIKDSGASNWLKIGETILSVITTLSFLVLPVIQHFLLVLQVVTWNLLHILAPLAMLACLFPSLSNIPRGIFMGMLEVALWTPMWVIISKILLAIGFGESPKDGVEFLDAIIMNFAVIGLMASTPKLVHGFLAGAMASVGGSTLQTMIAGVGTSMMQRPMRFLKSQTERVDSGRSALQKRFITNPFKRLTTTRSAPSRNHGRAKPNLPKPR